MPKAEPVDLPSETPEPPSPGVPAAVRVKALTPTQGGPEQQVWNRAEKIVRNLVRTPQRQEPGGIGGFLVPENTSDQYVVDMTAQLVKRDFADQMHLKSELIKDIYSNETADIIAKAPETFVYAGTQLMDQNLVHTLGESLHWLSTQYGDDYVAPWLQTYMISDNVSAAKTRAMIEQIAMEDVAPFSPGTGAVSDRAYAADLLAKVIDGTLKFDDLSAPEQLAVRNLAAQVRTEGEQVAATGTDRISKGLWIYSSGDYGMALNDAELAQIDSVIEQGTRLAPGATSDLNSQQKALDKLGIDQIQAIDDGILVLDDKWAVEHPDDLAAITSYLQQRYPDVQIQVGRQGVVGHVLDLIGEPADAVGNYVGSIVRGASEVVEGIGPDDSKELLTRAAYLRKKMELGAVPEDEIDDTLYEIGRLEEDASNDVGVGALQDFYEEGSRNASTGGGFGELTTQGMGIMPGDTGYSAAVAAWTIFGQIAFDPTTYIIPVARGLGAARRLPLVTVGEIPEVADVAKVFRESPDIIHSLGLEGATADKITQVTDDVARLQIKHLEKLAKDGIPDAVHGALTRRVYRQFADTADAWRGTKPYQRYVETFTDLRNTLGEDRFATVLGRNGWDNETAVRLSKALNSHDMDLAVGTSMLPSPNTPQVVEINSEIDDITDQLAAGRNALVESYPEGTVFHGTQAPVEDLPDITKADVLQYGNPNGLAGPGLYLTDNSDVAGLGTKGYSTTRGGKGTPRVLGGQVNPDVKLLDGNAVLPDDVASTIDDWARAQGNYIETPADFTAAGKSWMETIKEVKTGLAEAGLTRADAAEALTELQYKLEQTHGYGGVTHTGGINPARPGKPTHGVTVLWDTGDTSISAKISHVPPGPPEPATMAAFRNVESDLMSRKAWLESLKSPSDVRVHGVGLPPKKVLNHIVKLGKADRVYALDHLTNALQDTSAGWRSRFFFRMDHLWKQAGTSREIFLDGPKQIESVQHLDEFAQYLELPQGRINELFEPWLTGKLTSESARWQWFDNTFKAMIDESPTIGAAGKQELRQWYHSFEGTRISDYVNSLGHTPDPVLPIRVNGRAVSGRPAWSSSEMRGVSMRLPSARTMRNYQTVLGRTLTRLDNAGTGSRLVSGAVHGIGSMWYAFNDVWRTFVLATRPVSLVGRVSLEQQIRIAAYGYSSAFNHPIQYFRSLGAVTKMHANDFSLFTDTSEFALGALIDDYSRRQGDLLNAGAVLKYGPSGPDKHLFDAIAEQLTHIGKSPEFNRYYIKGITGEPAAVAPGYTRLYRAGPTEAPLGQGRASFWSTELTDARDYEANAASLVGDSRPRTVYYRDVADDELAAYKREAADAGINEHPNHYELATTEEDLHRLDASDDWESWDVNKALEAFNHPDNAKVAAHWRNVYENEVDVADVSDGLTRTWQQVTEFLGDADPDVKTWLQAMLVRGESKLDGVNYKLGTQEFADKLKELDGNLVLGATPRWQTRVQEVPLNSDLYSAAEKSGPLRNVANGVLRLGFTKPDLALSRSPMFRQVASREYNSLIGYGYDIENAHRISQERAAAIVADHMFELGMHTPGEVFWRNLNPFFPAWRELFSTWLLRIPTKLGGAENAGLAWAIGMTAMTRRISAGIEGLMAGGFMERNPDGELVFKVGDAEIPVQSIAGIFPLPLSLGDTSKTWPERLQGVAPSLGAPATATLGLLQKATGDSQLNEFLDNVEHWVAPYGTDTSLGPTAVDAMFEAYGITMPWMGATTREMHETMRTSATIDGMRLWIEDHPKPPPPPGVSTEAQRESYMKTTLGPWYAAQIAAGERYARSIYLRKGIMGMFVPFRVDSVNEGKRTTEEMWSDMAVIRDLDIPGLSGKVIDDFLSEHPELESYMSGKYLDERANISAHEDIGTFFEAVQSGAVNIRTPEEWAAFNYARSTINFMQRRISQEEENLRDVGRDGFADYLLDPHAEDDLNSLQLSLENFRTWTDTPESRMPGQRYRTKAYLDAYDDFKKDRYGIEPSLLDTKEEKLLDINSALSEFDKLITLDPNGSDKWYDALDTVYKKLGTSPTDDWFDQARSYFFNNVNGKFYEKQRRIYDQIDVTDKGQQGPLFDQLRELAARYDDPRAHNGVIFPTPEEYQYSRWTPREQRSKVADWAALPSFYLTEFQREQVGYTIDPADQEKANRLATFASKVNDAVDNYADRFGREPTDEERQKGADKINQLGHELGLDAYLDEVNRPAYKRVTDALNLNDRSPAWKSLVVAADAINKYVEDSDYGDKKWNREYYFDWFVKQVDHAASNDKVLSEVLSEVQDGLEGAVGNQAGGDFLRYLFFGWYPSRNDDFREADLTS